MSNFDIKQKKVWNIYFIRSRYQISTLTDNFNFFESILSKNVVSGLYTSIEFCIFQLF